MMDVQISNADLLASLDDVAKDATTALNEVHGLCRQVWDLDNELDDLKKKSADIGNQRRTLIERTIPEKMRQAQLSKATLSDGTAVALKEEMYASIPKEGGAAALAWLTDNGFGDLIKNEITATFAKGEDQLVEKLVEKLNEIDIDYSQKRGVHHLTLAAFLKEQVGKGTAVPLALFGAFMVTKANIKPPSKKE